MTMDKISSFAVECAELGPLAALSIQHTQRGMTPDAPSNEDRARAFRNAQPVALANDFKWPFRRVVGGQQAVARLLATGTTKSARNAGVRWLAPLLPLSKALIGTDR